VLFSKLTFYTFLLVVYLFSPVIHVCHCYATVGCGMTAIQMGPRVVICPDSFIDFGAVYIVCLFVCLYTFFLSYFLLSLYFFPHLFTSLLVYFLI